MISDKIQTVKVEIPAQQGYFYPIIIGENILDKVGELVKKYTRAKNLLVVTNKTIYPLYGEQVKASLLKEGFKIDFVILEDGEKYKDIRSLEAIWQKAIKFKLERKDAFIALGGGVVGDVTGFAAATYLRGVDFIQIPTTLLSQVDSSVGGKVAINNKLGKNLIGNFYQPKFVLTDIATLKTLPESELKVGLAEVLKYGMIEKSCGICQTVILSDLRERENLLRQSSFLDYLRQNKDSIFSLNTDTIQELVKYCCELKATVVNKDEKEAGLRAILNFGHTIGHAVEKCSNYENINHGKAIAIGMKGALFISKSRKLINENYYKYCMEALDLYGMDYKIPEFIKIKALYEVMFGDKKVLSGKIRFVLSTGKSEVDIFNDIEEKTIFDAIKTLY